MIIRSEIILYIFVIGTCTAQSQCKVTEWLKPKTCTDKTLPKGNAFNVFSTNQKLKCMKACETTTAGSCSSVSYDRRNRLCYQFDDIGDSCSDMVEEPDTQYYYKDICLNGGIKNSSNNCDCPVGVSGRRCNTLLGCRGLYYSGVQGIHKIPIQVTPDGPPLPVYCFYQYISVMIHQIEHPFSFNRTWEEYVNGFDGGEHAIWQGLETLHQITKYTPEKVLVIDIVLETTHHTSAFEGFKVGDRSTNYRMTYSSFNHPANQYLGNVLDGLNGSSFSTYDRDNDGDANKNCALQYAGGWWFNGPSGCSRNSVTSLFTCPAQHCDPMAIKQFPDSANSHKQVVMVNMYLEPGL